MREALKTGIDLVTFSGDKLLGGPQAGIIVGSREVIDKVRKHPMARALRIDKLTLAALEATLRLYLDPQKALEEIPTLRMLSISDEELQQRCERLLPKLQDTLGDAAELNTVRSQRHGRWRRAAPGRTAGLGDLPGFEEHLPE